MNAAMLMASSMMAYIVDGDRSWFDFLQQVFIAAFHLWVQFISICRSIFSCERLCQSGSIGDVVRSMKGSGLTIRLYSDSGSM